MKRLLLFAAFLLAAAACQPETLFSDEQKPEKNDTLVFHATIASELEGDTKTFMNDDWKVRWNEGDKVSIFNRNTVNLESTFQGEEGASQGDFISINSPASGEAVSHIYGIYPYSAATSINTEGEINLSLPENQVYYGGKSFGKGANTSVSVSDDENLMFKNVGGFLVIKLYGSGVSVSKVVLTGHNGEKLSGSATVEMSINEAPAVTMQDDATEKVSMICNSPVTLGAGADHATRFVLVIPPTDFENGFSIRVTDSNGGVYLKSTSNPVSIGRNQLVSMSPLEVTPDYTYNDNIEFADAAVKALCVANWDKDGDGELSKGEAKEVTSLGSVFYRNHDIRSFDELQYFTGLTRIDDEAFWYSGIASVVIPENVTTIGMGAFSQSALTSITIPPTVTFIDELAFGLCYGLTSVTLSEGITTLEAAVFQECGLKSIIIPNSVTHIKGYAFFGTRLSSITIPEGVIEIGDSAFSDGPHVVTIPATVKSIGAQAFWAAEQINVLRVIPPQVGSQAFNGYCTIKVPAGSEAAYKSAPGWSNYASNISSISLNTEYVDLGLSVKWLTCNANASSPEDLGTFFTWTEARERYSTGTYRLPTNAELEELIENCTITRVHDGMIFSRNGASLFLPNTGTEKDGTYYPYYNVNPLYDGGSYYWSNDSTNDPHFQPEGYRLRWINQSGPDSDPAIVGGGLSVFRYPVRLVKP